MLKSAAAACPGHAPKLESRDDPKWKYFESDLFPDLGQQRYIADYSVIMQLMENGDDGEAERPIEHLAYFPTEESRDEFVAWCGANGFKVTEVDDEADDETEAFAVEFNHIGPAVIDDVWEKTMLATEGAELFGGEYDGWQCSVVGEDGKPTLE